MSFIQRLATTFQRDNERYFRTRNLHLAVILLAQGFSLVGVDRTNPHSHEFAFRRNFELEQTVERFNHKLPIFVEARHRIYSWKALREKMHSHEL